MSSQEARCGSDSQLPFGWCALSLRPAVDPVATPSGHVYSREAILEHLVTKQAELKRARELWEAEQAADARREREASARNDETLLLEFEQANDPLVRDAPAAAKPGPKRARLDDGSYSHSNFAAPVKTGSTELVAELSRTSYWLPSFTPEAPAKKLAEPPRRPPSPMTGAPLRSKDLYKLDLRKAESAKTSRNDHDGSDVRYLCHVSGDEITTQNVLLIRNTGCVVLEPVATRLGLMKEKRCPVSGAKFKDKDVVKLKTAVSGYSASGGKDLVVKKYRAQGGGA
ncbi:hypothetical protein AURANDRAFT_20970 [Aureococcus anophagefferens]|uniref:Nitric oxide synthase-interacting protein zinc-finger domain-containing protein n=1 Tax=Aureococcus anophagefferens TaxID=44056 RepID=F0XZI5_AURAN|nr:hypothetical protein AURANDRAFT_20970 [Aureococcus anophagefferens]EGB11610.1 hypothetical protein AURANDRAFT_20970 [Aureococcus anophagefferens]|eukprot:XP_009033958.1 hypothetical protein AURANDRAFT_20970 [Aureococcus anophagefferens]